MHVQSCQENFPPPLPSAQQRPLTFPVPSLGGGRLRPEGGRAGGRAPKQPSNPPVRLLPAQPCPPRRARLAWLGGQSRDPKRRGPARRGANRLAPAGSGPSALQNRPSETARPGGWHGEQRPRPPHRARSWPRPPAPYLVCGSAGVRTAFPPRSPTVESSEAQVAPPGRSPAAARRHAPPRPRPAHAAACVYVTSGSTPGRDCRRFLPVPGSRGLRPGKKCHSRALSRRMGFGRLCSDARHFLRGA